MIEVSHIGLLVALAGVLVSVLAGALKIIHWMIRAEVRPVRVELTTMNDGSTLRAAVAATRDTVDQMAVVSARMEDRLVNHERGSRGWARALVRALREDGTLPDPDDFDWGDGC